MIPCLVDGVIVGNCSVRWSESIKTGHRATVGIAVVRAFWGQGIGTRMMEEMIRIARSSGRVTQLELGFIEGNARARALYEKMGFRINGIVPNAVRLKNGTLLNEYLMVKELGR